ncbi:hypothetical protein M0G43_15255 [Subsaxibacter sp. CAU 1640]|uniref:hypothetical protein n=1 Tax=Subsaxibacter sp. CAU 1640 TaxID=2933271 RepID=UPI0020043B37|nr:hypothetical protein [Subsaxibacter sp. CAU 1640]MCK7591944.1 hypothetical protein [Subsaxibacter sp. CAU 1640]
MNKLKYIFSAAMLSALIFGCDAEKASQDPEALGSTENYPTPTFTLSEGELTTNERNETVIVYDVVLDRPIDRPIDFSWVILDSSTATEHDDFDVVNGTVPAYQTTGQLMIMIYNDIEVEGAESLNLTIESGPSLANRYLVNPDTSYPEVNITINDYRFCLWILDATDVYGDGWNGGYIELVTEGETTTYMASDENDVFEIPITVGADYSFTYVSGGGTGGAPGWESENYYELTAPDGTVYSDGSLDYSGIPTPGLITSGTSSCE